MATFQVTTDNRNIPTLTEIVTKTELPSGELRVTYCPPGGITMEPELRLILRPHFAGLGYDVYNLNKPEKRIGNIPTQNLKDNFENGFYILIDNSK